MTRLRLPLLTSLAALTAVAACSKGPAERTSARAAAPATSTPTGTAARLGRRGGDRRSAGARGRPRPAGGVAARPAAAGGVRDPQAGPRRAHMGATARDGGRATEGLEGRASRAGGRRQGGRALAVADRLDLRAEQGTLRRPEPRGRGGADPDGARAARAPGAPGGVRERAAPAGEGGGPPLRSAHPRRDPGGRPVHGPADRARDDRRVHRLPVSLLPPRAVCRRRGADPLQGQGPARPPRLPARGPPGRLPGGPRGPLRRRSRTGSGSTTAAS